TFILDGAQSAGHLPIHVADMHIDLLCVPGHKGLYGPQGSGMIVCGSDRWVRGETLVEGGSGMHSLDSAMPDVLPERYEAGTLPTPAIAGLREGIRFVRQIGLPVIHQTEAALWRSAYERLSEMPGVRLYDDTPGSVLLFNVEGMSSVDVGAVLDSRGICVRSGYHCAPMAHRTIGTAEMGGVRASFGVMNTDRDVLRFADAVRQIARDAKNGV
ncbi:MAG: aminotransferase class V-fold PLP-dependent enzyme, partial [Clostridia bacterium]|nr:aminotransferase class V-fold PLP-dependent enzyme [Clostridia bacterium]